MRDLKAQNQVLPVIQAWAVAWGSRCQDLGFAIGTQLCFMSLHQSPNTTRLVGYSPFGSWGILGMWMAAVSEKPLRSGLASLPGLRLLEQTTVP